MKLLYAPSKAAATGALLLLLAAAVAAAAPPEAAEDWEVPDMREALADAWSSNAAAAADAGEIHTASTPATPGAAAACGAAAAVKSAGCPALLDPGFGWWTGNADRRNAFLMSVLVRDNYPMTHNLGADGDDTPAKRELWQCLLRAKWRALGAEQVEFYGSPLNDVVAVRAGRDVFINFRGTWTQAHRDNNMEWHLGPRKRLWGQLVRYHTGWGKTAEDGYQAVKDIVTKKFGVSGGACTLWISGHSRGGGAALLSAAFAEGRDGAAAPCRRVGGVWTFGSVKPGDGNFNKVYNAKLGSRTFNWWNQIDVVPTLPPGIAGYGSQLPRLRVGANLTCPAATSTSTCIKVGSKSACPARRNGAFNHHDYEYTAALGKCASQTLGIDDGCVDALAPPYSPPDHKHGGSGGGNSRASQREQSQRQHEQDQQQGQQQQQHQRGGKGSKKKKGGNRKHA